MKPEAQRRAIAISQGWWVSAGFGGVGSIHSPKCSCFDGAECFMPDYLNSFDAIHAAIRIRTIDEQWAIFAALAEIVDAELPAYMGTPAQYAEAYLRALNLWDGSK